MKTQGCHALAILILAISPMVAPQPPANTDWWKPVEAALGRNGQMQSGDVFKFSMPRRDLTVVKNDVTLAPGLALGSWAAFRQMGSQTMLMGDLVLTQDEIEPVMLRLQQDGIDQTSIHNHLLGENPHIIYMHIAGRGDRVKLASSLAAALALTKTPASAPSPANSAGAKPIDVDVKSVEQALGYPGKVNGGILQFAIPRVEKITDGGMELPPAMGVATAINFQPTGGGKAAIAGDFVMLATEVNPVLRALRAHGIEVEAMHNHMLFDEPHLYFVHFWANDNAVTLARGLHAALEATNSQKSRQE